MYLYANERWKPGKTKSQRVRDLTWKFPSCNSVIYLPIPGHRATNAGGYSFGGRLRVSCSPFIISAANTMSSRLYSIHCGGPAGVKETERINWPACRENILKQRLFWMKQQQRENIFS